MGLVLARLLGFRYDRRRDAYVMRVVGERFGPVLKRRDRLGPVIGGGPPQVVAMAEWEAELLRERSGENGPAESADADTERRAPTPPPTPGRRFSRDGQTEFDWERALRS